VIELPIQGGIDSADISLPETLPHDDDWQDSQATVLPISGLRTTYASAHPLAVLKTSQFIFGNGYKELHDVQRQRFC
jgi:hypothetical protein